LTCRSDQIQEEREKEKAAKKAEKERKKAEKERVRGRISYGGLLLTELLQLKQEKKAKKDKGQKEGKKEKKDKSDKKEKKDKKKKPSHNEDGSSVKATVVLAFIRFLVRSIDRSSRTLKGCSAGPLQRLQGRPVLCRYCGGGTGDGRAQPCLDRDPQGQPEHQLHRPPLQGRSATATLLAAFPLNVEGS
jgi:hypothetical protein